MLRRWLPCCAIAILALAPRAASADGESNEGSVVEVESDDLVLDLGSARGVSDGDFVEIWRPLHLRHPVTGKVLTDRFLIGKLRLVQVRSALSLAVPEGALSRPARPGDVIVLPHAAPPVHTPAPLVLKPVASPTTPVATVPAPPTPEQVEDEELSKVFDGLHGANFVERIRAYEQFAAAHPKGHRTTFLLEEARALRTLLTMSEQHDVGEQPKPPPIVAEMAPVSKVVAHESVRLAIEVHGVIAGAVLHVRAKGSKTYESIPMSRSGPVIEGAPETPTEYWAAMVPAESVEPPELRYFIEAVDARGTVTVIGTPDVPEVAQVESVLPRAPSKAMGQAAIWSDYASFNARAANDYIFQTEGYMGARFGDTGLRALRTGFGVYRGEGAVPTLDTTHPVPVGLTYGYLEVELGLTKYVSLGLRSTVGLDNSGVNGGAFGFVRIGSDLGTNLWFGAEGLGGIGVRGITQFEWNAFYRWPIVFRTEVTNEPAGGDIGVRAIAQVGYRILPHLLVSVRGSYQGRTIDHSGPGGGGAVAYAW
jgi:hypothetical protein